MSFPLFSSSRTRLRKNLFDENSPEGPTGTLISVGYKLSCVEWLSVLMQIKLTHITMGLFWYLDSNSCYFQQIRQFSKLFFFLEVPTATKITSGWYLQNTSFNLSNWILQSRSEVWLLFFIEVVIFLIFRFKTSTNL